MELRMRESVKESASHSVVTWKDEGGKDEEEFGPCVVHKDNDRQDKGWMTKVDAQKLANEIDADFEEL